MEEDPLAPPRTQSSFANSADGFNFKPLDHSTQRHIVDSIRHQRNLSDKTKKVTQHGRATPSDSELLGSMASRLALVERELLAAKREVIEKDNYISQLEERIVALEKSLRKQNTHPTGEQDQRREELEIKCRALQKQVDDMEVRFNT